MSSSQDRQDRHYRFEHFEWLPGARQLRVNGQAVPLGGRAYDLLLVLFECRDRTVGKDELLSRVWPDQMVEENNLTVHVAALRKAIGASAITTVTGRGYRFTARETAQAPGPSATAKPAALPSGGLVSPAQPPVLALPNIPSIAVLPFQNMSGDPAQDYFADGMVEDIITALARMKVFFVIARNSSFAYRGRAVDIKTVGRELGVRYVLEGSVRQSGQRLRITGQLIDASDDHHVWADRFEGGRDDVFALQDQITDAIALALEPSIRRAEFERTRVLPTASLQAYDLGWRALAKLRPNTTRADNDEALALVARAVQMDPNFARGHALGALACVTRLTQGYGDVGDMKTGLRYAEQALAANTDDPTVLCLAGLALGTMGLRAPGGPAFGFRYDEAARTIERALEGSPNLIMVQYCAGYLRLILGEAEASRAHYVRCARISPLDPMKSVFIAGEGNTHLLTGQYEQALGAGIRAIEESPNYPVGHRVVVAALGFLGRWDEARVVAARLLELSPRFTVSSYESRVPYRSAEFRSRMAAVYRGAGLPE